MNDVARFRGCLLGGAVGDALGAPVEFHSWDHIAAIHGAEGVTRYEAAYGRTGAITDDTQMTLFTAEGLVRAATRRCVAGVWDPVPSVHRAYLRWLATQGSGATVRDEGWLVTQTFLHDRRAPGMTCLGALQTGRMGTPHEPLNDSMGCGGVMRVAPVGLLLDDLDEVFEVARDAAAVTHGNPEGYLPAGAFAVMIAAAVKGADVAEAVEAGRAALGRRDPGGPTDRLVDRAVELAARGGPTPADLESLGGAWVGHEALAISVCCALASEGEFGRGVRMAVNHSGDSDSTGAVCGNLLGAALGEGAIPSDLLDGLEGRDVITAVADDLLTARDLNASTADAEWLRRYPPT